jgi:hypothetical protein
VFSAPKMLTVSMHSRLPARSNFIVRRRDEFRPGRGAGGRRSGGVGLVTTLSRHRAEPPAVLARTRSRRGVRLPTPAEVFVGSGPSPSQRCHVRESPSLPRTRTHARYPPPSLTAKRRGLVAGPQPSSTSCWLPSARVAALDEPPLVAAAISVNDETALRVAGD